MLGRYGYALSKLTGPGPPPGGGSRSSIPNLRSITHPVFGVKAKTGTFVLLVCSAAEAMWAPAQIQASVTMQAILAMEHSPCHTRLYAVRRGRTRRAGVNC